MGAVNIIRPQQGFQEQFVRTNVDFCIGGGSLNVGKTFATVLSSALPALDGKFNGLYLRNNLGDLKAGGGIADTFREIYGDKIKIVETGDPHIDFPSGARIDLTHVANQSREAIRQRFKGRQYDMIVFDEGTGYTWEAFTEIFTRCRGKANWTGHVLMTTNPEKDHWIRSFIDWYVGDDGFIREDRSGIVRYFYINGESVHDVVWGNSKEEVITRCKSSITKRLSRLNKKKDVFKAEDLVKSFTFYLGSMSENTASISGNSGYAGSVAVVGGRAAEQYIEGNWNMSTRGEIDAPITQDLAAFVFENDPQTNGDQWITADLADYGTDNFIALVWDGFHVKDMLIVSKSTPMENAYHLKSLCAKHNIREDRVIFDATNGMYIKDYLPSAIPYVSNHQPMGVYGRQAVKLKDECYMRLASVIRRRMFSFDEKIGKQFYIHAKLSERIDIKTEFLEECCVVNFREAAGGRKSLYTKKEMRKLLGKSRSTDLLDPCAMRMFPVLKFEHGQELTSTAAYTRRRDDYDDTYIDIYDETNWC